MAGISSYDSNSISTLLASLPVYRGNSGASNMLTGLNLTDYSCIKSGSYYKLMKSYFAENPVKSDKTDKKDLSTAKDDTETLSEIKGSSESLAKTATDLYKATGTDDEKLLSGVKNLIADYNKTLKAVGKSETDSISRAGASLINYTNTNSSLLEKVGIKINTKDYSLSLDEEVFKSASRNNKQSLFKGTGSFAYGIGVKASMIQDYAKRESSKSNTYGKKGNYSDTYSAGNILNSLM